jgi:predicted NBD/HSP70 family sugar kinase
MIGAQLVVDLGATWTRIGWAGDERPSLRFPTPMGRDQLLDEFSGQALGLMRTADEVDHVKVACPGLVRDGVVLRSLYTPLSGVNLQALLEARIGVRVAVLNDVDAQALGDPGYNSSSSYFIVSSGTAVGGAYVRHGDLVTGRDGSISEVGHFPVGLHDTRCACGGFRCLDTVLSGRHLAATLGENWWSSDSSSTAGALIDAGVALSRALRCLGALLDLEYIRLVGSVFNRGELWRGFAGEHCGLGSDVGIVHSPDAWPLVAALNPILMS